MGKLVKATIGALLVILLIATAYATTMKNVTVSVTVNDSRTPVNVFVNGINLDDKIDELESKFNFLLGAFKGIKVTIADYIYLNELKHELLEAYDSKLIKMVQSNETNASELVDVLKKQRLVRAKVDELTLRILSEYTTPKVTYPDRGWIDIYGNHRSFDDPEYVINPEFDFRLTDCYSAIGRSAVIKGGTIKITGVLYTGGTVSTERMEVTLIDPESGEKPKVIVATEVGENASNLNYNTRIYWVTPTTFVIEINTSDMYPGLKQIDIKYSPDHENGYKVSCTFAVIKPYLETQTFGNFTRIVTNYPTLIVNGEIVKPVNGVFWIKDVDPEVVGIPN